MQQAYQAIRIVSEAQTIRVGLSTDPDELMLHELCSACASLSGEASNGIKAIVLDFNTEAQHVASHLSNQSTSPPSTTAITKTYEAVRAVAQPVLAVARDTLSPAACKLLPAADLTLVAEHARLIIAGAGQEAQEEILSGANAARLGYVTWSAAASDIGREMERILNMLREKSAVALRHAKASARLGQATQLEPGQAGQSTPLEALQRINTLYLEEVMRTEDASEGLRAFLEKRKPHWKNK
ncbi:MAG: enoyl-CoA hydratase [Ktedonobacteraceae bacterium]